MDTALAGYIESAVITGTAADGGIAASVQGAFSDVGKASRLY